MFNVIIRKSIIKKIDKLKPYEKEIKRILTLLSETPIIKGRTVKLSGYENTYRIRIGRIRIIYKIFWKEKNRLCYGYRL